MFDTFLERFWFLDPSVKILEKCKNKNCNSKSGETCEQEKFFKEEKKLFWREQRSK